MKFNLCIITLLSFILIGCSSTAKIGSGYTVTEKSTVILHNYCLTELKAFNVELFPYRYVKKFESCNIMIPKSNSKKLIQGYINSLILIGRFKQLHNPNLLKGKASITERTYWMQQITKAGL